MAIVFNVIIVFASIICGVIAGMIYGHLKEVKDVEHFAYVFFSDRIEIERAFNEWADKNGVAKVPNALVAFLQINGLLNRNETVKFCRARRLKKHARRYEE